MTPQSYHIVSVIHNGALRHDNINIDQKCASRAVRIFRPLTTTLTSAEALC